jgi:hypothetical protein
VVSHGWTHDPLWYDHIGRHLASYGYIVMSHANDVGDGDPLATETASTATLDNIDFLLGHPPEAADFAADAPARTLWPAASPSLTGQRHGA